MVFSTEPVWSEIAGDFTKECESAVVYADFEEGTVLHEGPLGVLGNEWVELPSGRLLSPDAIHHVDAQSE
jgi:hypothetical protein